MKLWLGEARVKSVQVRCHAIQVFLLGVLSWKIRWPLSRVHRTSLYAIPMDTLFLSATLEVIGLFECHGCRFYVFDFDRNCVACRLSLTLINIMRQVGYLKIINRHHLELSLFLTRCE